MKNIKKIIDFEITLFLTLIFLFIPFLAFFKFYYINSTITDITSFNSGNFMFFAGSNGVMVNVENPDKDTDINLINVPFDNIITKFIFKNNNFENNMCLYNHNFTISYNSNTLKIDLNASTDNTLIYLIYISYTSIFLCIMLCCFICISIIYFIYKILSLIFFIASRIKRFLSKPTVEDSSLEYINLNTYDLLIAYTLYNKSLYLYELLGLFEKFFKKENYLCEDNTINVQKTNNLPAFEQLLLNIYNTTSELESIDNSSFTHSDLLMNKISKINSDFAKEEKLYDIEQQIISKLKQDKLIKFTTIRHFFGTSNKKYIQFLKSLNLEEFLSERTVEFLYITPPSIYLALLLLIIFACICLKFNLYLVFLLIPIVLTCVFNCDRIFLTNKGFLEKTKIFKYKTTLQKTSDLTEREKLFLELFK